MRFIMLETAADQKRQKSGLVVQVNFAGLVIFSAALVLAAGMVAYAILAYPAKVHASAKIGSFPAHFEDGPVDSPGTAETPPWGDLTTLDIEIEQPEEYVAFELQNAQPERWFFPQATKERVAEILRDSGLPTAEITHAMSAGLAQTQNGNVMIQPDDNLEQNLTPACRAKLYGVLAHCASNHYMLFPFTFSASELEGMFQGSQVDPKIAELTRQLTYRRGDRVCFSDYEYVLGKIPTEKARLQWVKTLSRQSAVLARLRVGPDTDIEKIIGYWGRGVQAKDARPLLESLKRSPQGGSISLVYLLPRFARDRLYTFPVPARPGEPPMDCHWSTLNFFNDAPDNRFADLQYTAQYLTTNYYPGARASQYGDVVLILDEHGNAIHSALYLADDLVFTKNGNNFAQPWKLMRLSQVVSMYAMDNTPRAAFYRRKN